jgi:hypothetical protein
MPVAPIHGHTEPSDAMLKLVNHNKMAKEKLLQAIERLVTQGVADARWVEIARAHSEQGHMALNRAILQPERVKLPD